MDWSLATGPGAAPAESDPSAWTAVRFNVLPDHSTEIRTTRAAIVNPGEVITPSYMPSAGSVG